MTTQKENTQRIIQLPLQQVRWLPTSSIQTLCQKPGYHKWVINSMLALRLNTHFKSGDKTTTRKYLMHHH